FRRKATKRKSPAVQDRSERRRLGNRHVAAKTHLSDPERTVTTAAESLQDLLALFQNVLVRIHDGVGVVRILAGDIEIGAINDGNLCVGRACPKRQTGSNREFFHVSLLLL